ncbi:MAG: stage II sporulation protein M [Janthinobacterium lividum]
MIATTPARALRSEREDDWLRLENLLDRLERHSARKLSDEELLAIPVLYRAVLSSLSVARATVLDAALVDYLEALSTRAYFVVYGARASLASRVGRFFVEDWPRAARALVPETLAAGGFILAGAVAGYLMVRADAGWFYGFVPTGLAGGRDPAASTEMLREALGGAKGTEGLPFFAGYLFTHNAQVAILSFALGFALCLPTAFLLAYSGGSLGALMAVYAGRGLGPDFGAWLMVHGVTELLAVALAGAAGFHIGRAVASPGRLGRLDAAALAGRRAATLLAGTFIMLICAALLEGIVRQTVIETSWRYTIAGATALFWSFYLYRPRRRSGT